MPYRPVRTMNNTAFQTARRKAGLDRLRVHDLRHTFGQRLSDAGVSEEDRALLLGHAMIGMPQHYATATIARLNEAANKVQETRDRTTLLRVVIEVEFHNKDRIIPFDVLLEPGRYVAGAYPCLRWISDQVSRIPTIANAASTSYDALMRHARNAYGQLIDTAECVEGSAEAAIERLKRPG